MSKYIIEIPDGVPYVLLRREEFGITEIVPVVGLEELTIDYIKENCKSLLNEFYQKGYKEGRKVGIKDGMCEAWEAARKIIHMPEGDLLNIFTECYSAVCTALQVLLKYDASEAIAKLKAYEEHKDDPIKVGDVIANNTEPKLKVWVSTLNELGFCGIAITDFGSVKKGELYDSCSTKGWRKTGNHINIDRICEVMENG